MAGEELSSRLRRIEIKTARLANREMAGQYRSVFKGRGMSFEEVRPYQQGDDVRGIDWNVSARTGELYVKVFVEERELTVLLLLDMSPSARFGTTASTRQELLAEVAAVHAFSVIRNNDRIGLIIFTDRVEHFVPPKKGRTHVLRVIRDILEFKPSGRGSGRSGIPEAIRYLMNVTKKTSIALLMSDFFLTAEELNDCHRSLSVAAQRHDLLAYLMRDRADDELPPAGLIEFEDLESGQLRLLDAGSARVRRAFADQAAADRTSVQRMLKRLAIDHELLRTGQDYVPAINQLFARRARRAR